MTQDVNAAAGSGVINPDDALSYVDTCASFWRRAHDPVHGGFFTFVGRDGSVENSNIKTTVILSRNAYGYARAYMLTGKSEYLDYARSALDFMYEHAWDEDNGGWLAEFNRDGSVVDTAYRDLNSTKWSFVQHYALVGPAAMYEATGNRTDYEYLLKGYDAIDQGMWDGRDELAGYYDFTDADWSNPRGKGFGPTVDAITTHVEALCRLGSDRRFTVRLEALADCIVEKLAPTIAQRRFGFAEEFDNEWQVTGSTRVMVGHVLKAAWVLARTYLVSPRPIYRETAAQLLNHVLEHGYDHEHGGPFGDYDGATGQPLSGTNKCWWMMEEAFTAAITNYYISGDVHLLDVARKTWEFYSEHFVDKEYGEVYKWTAQLGGRVGSDEKGSYWKGGYHSIEFGYYAYLYSHLMVDGTPAELYYRIDVDQSDRKIALAPLSCGRDSLRVLDVARMSVTQSSFDPSEQSLCVSRGDHGEFKVTFVNDGVLGQP